MVVVDLEISRQLRHVLHRNEDRVVFISIPVGE